MKLHGTALMGETANGSKLTEDDIAVIRKMIRNGAGNRDIADYFGVSDSNVSMIRTGRIWAWLRDD